MSEIKQIVVPIDFGSHTDKLVSFATYIADKLSAKVTFLHVSGIFGRYGGIAHISFDQAEKELCKHADQSMTSLIEDLKEKCPGCTGKVTTGDIVDEIIGFAKEGKADLIIIATHGAKGLEKIMLGSVAERVVKNAPCPTLIFNPYQ